MELCAAALDVAGVVEGFCGHGEVVVGVEAEEGFGGADLVGVWGACVGGSGAAQGGHGVADASADAHEGGWVVGAGDGGVGECGVEDVEVFSVVDGDDAESVGGESCGDVFAADELGGAFDGDAVVVPEDDEAAESEVSGEGGYFVGDAFHEVAVGDEAPDAMVEGAGAGGCVRVEGVAPVAGVEGHADGVAESLAEGAGGGFDAGGVSVFGVAWGEGVEGAGGAQVVEVESVSAEVELEVEGEAGVSGGKDEAVAAGPGGVGGVVS
ncbi:hypothetical protein KEM60_03288 [Austwickia sp. TVS 96-490-7B]|nr:hypothetical protein [Austwickia sp. TVS 96-490-7B]